MLKLILNLCRTLSDFELAQLESVLKVSQEALEITRSFRSNYNDEVPKSSTRGEGEITTDGSKSSSFHWISPNHSSSSGLTIFQASKKRREEDDVPVQQQYDLRSVINRRKVDPFSIPVPLRETNNIERSFGGGKDEKNNSLKQEPDDLSTDKENTSNDNIKFSASGTKRAKRKLAVQDEDDSESDSDSSGDLRYDLWDVFFKSVAYSLRSLPNAQAMRLKLKISQMVGEAELAFAREQSKQEDKNMKD